MVVCSLPSLDRDGLGARSHLIGSVVVRWIEAQASCAGCGLVRGWPKTLENLERSVHGCSTAYEASHSSHATSYGNAFSRAVSSAVSLKTWHFAALRHDI